VNRDRCPASRWGTDPGFIPNTLPGGEQWLIHLNRDLKVGDKVVMKATGESVEIALESFGCFASTSGSKICVTRGYGEPLHASGHDIDADETIRRHARENGFEEA
jgi:hypothetical protein